MRKSEKSYAGWYFLSGVIALYLVVGFLKGDTILPSLRFSLKVVKKIIPVFIGVFALIVITNYSINPQRVRKYLAESAGVKRWLIAVVGGIISTGAIYMWYLMLKELKKKESNTASLLHFFTTELLNHL